MEDRPLLRGALALLGLSKSFRDGARELPVLQGVDLDVASGEVVAIVGASGSGKSTLLYVVGALDRDFGGEASVAGKPLRGLSVDGQADLRNRQIGFVFQSFNLLPGLSALENVMLPGILRRGTDAPSAGELRRRAAEALERVGLADRAHARPGRLSGGERQRVAIARALSAAPRVLLADEPTGNLDPDTSQGIMSLLERINRTGTTVLMATHDNNIVDAMRRRVIELDYGHIVRDQSRGVYGVGR